MNDDYHSENDQRKNQSASGDDRPVGLSCHQCGCRHLIVYKTRKVLKDRIKRYRRCRHCGQSMVTVERVVG